MSIENTQISEIDQSLLDDLFNSTPNTTPNADTLAIGKDKADSKTTFDSGANNSELQVLDDDFLATLDPDYKAPVEKPTPDDKTKDDKTTEKDKEPVTKEEEKSTEPESAVNTEVNEVLKSTVDYLVTQGFWADFEGREDLEITQEVYAELALKQNQNTAMEIVNELVDSTGAYGRAIINHIKSGGNPDEIIDLFKEQKAIEAIDTTTEEGKQLKIETYYKEVLGWKNEKVNKHVKRLIEDDEITTEFNEVEELYGKHYQRRLQETQEEANRQEQIQIQRKQAFANNIKSAIEEDSTITEREKRIIASSILDFKHQLEGGQKVNDFYLKFAEWQGDPKKYIKLVRFVMDPEGYEKSFKQKAETKAAKETFSFIKNNAAINTKATTDVVEKPRQQYKGTNFQFKK